MRGTGDGDPTRLDKPITVRQPHARVSSTDDRAQARHYGSRQGYSSADVEYDSRPPNITMLKTLDLNRPPQALDQQLEDGESLGMLNAPPPLLGVQIPPGD